MKIKRLLIANRGEIALRIIRTCREMGIKSLAVYSDADSKARHVREADESFRLGPAEAAASYLNQAALIEAAKAMQADAVHPGYGFLSERAEFAETVAAAGLIYVGPPPSATRALGSKIEAKLIAQKAGVPLVPGFFSPNATDEELESAAISMGFPVLLKASAGGGGRGMRVVHQADDLNRELKMAREEAIKAFGEGSMMVEKLIPSPRHIEVQVLADSHGNVACLFDRECSLQRRHQKVIEEAPSPVMTDGLWQRMREACISLVRAAGYVGAGTVEFITDQAATDFYFLEVNARLQVEHPVTEMITGLDLVRQQILIAEGNSLDLAPDLMEGKRSAINGHSIEARIIAEDPSKGFLPSVGKLHGWAEPQGPGIRFDGGFQAGDEISQYYDSLMGKLIVQGSNREEARLRLINALEDTHILGVKTNISFVHRLAGSAAFSEAAFHTKWLDEEGQGLLAEPDELPLELSALVEAAKAGVSGGGVESKKSLTPAWDTADSFRLFR